MEFSFTEEQEMIRESADAFLSDVSSSQAVRKAMSSELGYDPQLWQRICQEMVWPALHIPEQYGGMGLGYVELVALLEQMGKHLLCSPFFSSVCLGANALLLAGSEDQKKHYLPQIAEGTITTSLAYSGKNNKPGCDAIICSYEQQGNKFVLNGEYHYVPNGHSVDVLILAAKSPEGKVSIFLVDANNPALTRTYRATMDQTRKQAEVHVHNLTLSEENLLGEAENAQPILEKLFALASIAVAAEQLGGIQTTLDASVEYSKERVQFNRPIASFQAIKHKAADMMLKAEAAKSAVYYAACIAQDFFEQGSQASELEEAASIAKAYCSDAYFFNAGSALQIHGGVGFTWEYDVHLYFKRAKSSETYLGNAAQHREALAKILLD